MNLITDPWIPVIRQNQQPDVIAPWQIAETDNPVIEIAAPRPDFQGALYQLLIGLLQTAFAPEDEDQWDEYWQEPPATTELEAQLQQLASVFELENSEGVAFLQDADLSDAENKPISTLLIDAPGENTIKKNSDHFVKRNHVEKLCSSCTAIALFTLQTNAPAGGKGIRVGLRGGGPLTTLIIPKAANSTLWQKIWLNVHNQEQLEAAKTLDARVLPWLGKTRLSEKGQITTPVDVHPLHAYWGMPRRIRLTDKIQDGTCDVCGKPAAELYQGFKTKNYGTNYDGAWVHPLTPYRFDPKKVNFPLSLKGQQGGLGYRHWLGLAMQDEDTGDKAASVVQFYNQERGRQLSDRGHAALWCFGYDMDNMKARCWYESRFPVYFLSDVQRTNLTRWAKELIDAAKEAIKLLRSEVKAAWFRRPEDAKGDMSQIDAQFWQATEADFYQLLEQLAVLPAETGLAPSGIYASWFAKLQKQLFAVFENATLAATPEDLDLKRIILAKNNLGKKFHSNKTIKNLKAKAQPEQEAS
ncbi:MAG: type I-E CRISPR-associated protein Cse1/CasA [Methylomonas sp.]|nr:MAG: type I-E CRISPR-associated protein Cse1/CasA [Methylomonas sp.]